MFYYENSKSDKPKGVINLEHYSKRLLLLLLLLFVMIVGDVE
jgi:hypothetical protein